MNKTKRQRQMERDHSKIISTFYEVSKEGGTQMAIWEVMEKKTGFSRQHITSVLRKNGINYQKKNDNEQAGN